LRRRIIELEATLDKPAKARRRTRNLLFSAACFGGGLLISPIMGAGSFVIALLSAHLLIDNPAEDNEIHVDDVEARAELQQLESQVKDLERRSRQP